MDIQSRIVLSVALVLAGISIVPPVSAHQDGCLIAEHLSPVKMHMGCTSTPNTCFGNVQVDGASRVHVLCEEPEEQPCTAKVMVLGVWVKSCKAV